MKSEEVPEIKVSPAGDGAESTPTYPAGSKIQKAVTIKERSLTSVVLPILAWPILDSFGDIDKQPLPTRIDRFLTRIYLFLFMSDGIQKQQRAMRPTLANAQESATKEKIPKVAKSLSELENYVANECTSQSSTDIFHELHHIFCIFIPEEHDQSLVPIQFYWGAVYEICVSVLMSPGEFH